MKSARAWISFTDSGFFPPISASADVTRSYENYERGAFTGWKPGPHRRAAMPAPLCPSCAFICVYLRITPPTPIENRCHARRPHQFSRRSRATFYQCVPMDPPAADNSTHATPTPSRHPVPHPPSAAAQPVSNRMRDRRKKRTRNEAKEPRWLPRERGFALRTNPIRTHQIPQNEPNEPIPKEVARRHQPSSPAVEMCAQRITAACRRVTARWKRPPNAPSAFIRVHRRFPPPLSRALVC